MQHHLRQPALPFLCNGFLKCLPSRLGIEGIARIPGMRAILGQIPKHVRRGFPIRHTLFGQGHGIGHWQVVC